MRDKNTKNNLSIHEGHRKRLRERFKTSKNAFAEHELLELLLSYSIPRKDTNALAHTLIKTFGSLKDVLNASPESLSLVDGVGENSALLISLVNYLNEQTKTSTKKVVKLTNIESVKNFSKSLYDGAKSEKLYLLYLDDGKNLLGYSTLDDNKINSVSLNFGAFTKGINLYKPSSVILVHNHFADFPYPSKDDDLATARIYTFLNIYNVNLYDHVIVGKKDSYSYFYDNRLQKIKETLLEKFL